MLLLPKHVDCTIYGLNVNTTIQINNNKRCISCALNSALVQLNKAEMEGKSILLGAGVGKQLKSRKKTSPSFFHLPQCPIKVFGAKVIIVVFGTKENKKLPKV